METEIKSLAAEFGVDAATVEFLAQHIVREFGQTVTDEASACDAVIAGTMSFRETTRHLVNSALTHPAEFNAAVLSMLTA